MTSKRRLLSSVAAALLAALGAGTVLAQTAPPAAAPAPASASASASAPTPESDWISGWSLTGNIGLFSQDVFRGISQTNEKPAVQGGFDLAHKSGLYIGTWASNVSWLSDGNPDVSASVEWDFYGGYKWSLPADFVLDFGAYRYGYPGHYPSNYTKPDTTELYVALDWKMLQAKYSYSVTNIFGFHDSHGSGYIEGNLNWDVVDKVNDYIGKVTLIGHVGHQSYHNWGAYSYTDWKAGASVKAWDLTWGLAVTGTNAQSALYTNRFGTDNSETHVVGWVQKTF